MGIPQYILIGMVSLTLFINFKHDGKPRKTKNMYDFKGQLVAAIILFSLLIWGGFFK